MIRFLSFFLLASAAAMADWDFYVATNGSDAVGVVGTLAQPWATLNRAAVCTYNSNQPAIQKNIWIRGGEYYNTCAYFNPSRNNNTLVASYPGESAYLYGGHPLTNWTDQGGGIWSAPLPEFPSEVTTDLSEHDYWCPRTLMVNGQMATWATIGKIHYSSYGTNWFVYTNDAHLTTNHEVSLDLSWSDVVSYITNVDEGTKTASIYKSFTRGANADDVSSYLLRNGPEGMTQDNTWWWDKTNLVVYYRPPVGQDPNTMTIIVPSTTRILRFRSSGTATTNFVISNLTFAVTTCSDYNYSDGAEGLCVGAITLERSTNCVVDGCTFNCMGGSAISPGTATSAGYGNIFRNNTVHHCGASGVFWAGKNCTISNNLVYACGLIGQSGCGIFASSDSLTCNNTVTNIVGCGIMHRPYATNGVIMDNWVQRCVQALRDMGAIYSWGSTNVTIFHNYVADVTGTNSDNGGIWDWFLHGIYCDAGSSNHVVASNIIYNCSRPIHNNTSSESNSFINNVTINLTPGETNCLFLSGTNYNRCWQRNVHYAAGAIGARVPVWDITHNDYYPIDTSVNDWTNNIVWSTEGSNGANPTNATSSDPLFINVPNGTPQWMNDVDYNFKPGSTATALGIQPLSMSGIGCSWLQLQWQRRASSKTGYIGTVTNWH